MRAEKKDRLPVKVLLRNEKHIIYSFNKHLIECYHVLGRQCTRTGGYSSEQSSSSCPHEAEGALENTGDINTYYISTPALNTLLG